MHRRIEAELLLRGGYRKGMVMLANPDDVEPLTNELRESYKKVLREDLLGPTDKGTGCFLHDAAVGRSPNVGDSTARRAGLPIRTDLDLPATLSLAISDQDPGPIEKPFEWEDSTGRADISASTPNPTFARLPVDFRRFYFAELEQRVNDSARCDDEWARPDIHDYGLRAETVSNFNQQRVAAWGGSLELAFHMGIAQSVWNNIAQTDPEVPIRTAARNDADIISREGAGRRRLSARDAGTQLESPTQVGGAMGPKV